MAFKHKYVNMEKRKLPNILVSFNLLPLFNKIFRCNNLFPFIQQKLALLVKNSNS